MNSSFHNDELATAVRLYKAIGRPTYVAEYSPESEPSSEKALNALKAKRVNLQMTIKTLKKESKPFASEVAELQLLIAQITELEAEEAKGKPRFDQELFQNLLKRRMIVIPGFEIHGGVAGLMDLGPIGAVLKDNILSVWKKHFIVREQMLQVDCTNITPHSVLQTSGHVERFTDLLVEELDDQGMATGEFHRADKLLEAFIEKELTNTNLTPKERNTWELLFGQAGSLDAASMDQAFETHKLVGPVTKRKLSRCRPFNLMFATTVGPSGLAKAYLRPETAQGIFVNFKRLFEYNAGKMPFASAQVGTGFRNEIAPKGGLIRCREFTMAEIEHFCHADFKTHERFDEVRDMVLQLFSRTSQTTTFETEWITVGKAVDSGMINNETLGYYMARSQEFLVKVGIDPQRLRFRQHLSTEMAHYASDCWDAEVKLSTGWLEIAGHADRSCFDLQRHSEATGEELKAALRFDVPKTVSFVKLEPNKKEIGSSFKKAAAQVLTYLDALDAEQSEAVDAKLAKGEPVVLPAESGSGLVLERKHCKLIRGQKVLNEEKYYPHVIEPSFGIGRIMQSVLEHSFWVKGDASSVDTNAQTAGLQRNVLALNALVAPVKVGVIPHGGSCDVKAAKQLAQDLCEDGWNAMTDVSSAAIGRKYARFDEIGVPFVVTLDDRTQEDGTVTLRERDSEEQVRVSKEEVCALVQHLCVGKTNWAQIQAQFPAEKRPVKPATE